MKRPNKWKRVLSEEEWGFIRQAHRYGVLVSIVSQIFTVDKEIVQLVILSGEYKDYIRRITKKVDQEEGGRDEIRGKKFAPKVRRVIPKTDRVGWGI